MQMEYFHAHDDSEIDIWTIFWDDKQYNSTHDKNIAHGRDPDMVKSRIVQYVFRTLTLVDWVCFAIGISGESQIWKYALVA